MPGSVTYHAIAGDWWPAEITAEHPDGRIDIVVDGLQLHRIKVFSGAQANCPRGMAWRPVIVADRGSVARAAA